MKDRDASTLVSSTVYESVIVERDLALEQLESTNVLLEKLKRDLADALERLELSRTEHAAAEYRAVSSKSMLDEALARLEDSRTSNAINCEVFQELQEKYESLRGDLYQALGLPENEGPADYSDSYMVSIAGSFRMRDLAMIAKIDHLAAEAQAPIRMLLSCPECFERHLDEGEWETRPHKTHECQKCGHQFKVCDRPTVGVKFLVPRAA